MMIKTNYKVRMVGFDSLEYFLNNYYKEFPNYHIYQIIPKHCYNGALAVVILEHNSMKGGAE